MSSLRLFPHLLLRFSEKAFNKIYMAGGKGTVKINAKDALSESGHGEIYFTRNGGTLDLNGYDQSFQ
ncbi:hypothetical protein GLN32_23335, partial [Shigella flexneri 2a]|nr:hypothetical protein [Shigella flexneri 2a]